MLLCLWRNVYAIGHSGIALGVGHAATHIFGDFADGAFQPMPVSLIRAIKFCFFDKL